MPDWTLCDVGSDHASLLASLLRSETISFGIAVENKTQPRLNSLMALNGLHAEVRLGDGLDPITTNECDGLSICGMGGRSMISILNRHPNRVPQWIFLQPNKDIEQVREWAFHTGFRLHDEALTSKLFTILVYHNPRQFSAMARGRSAIPMPADSERLSPNDPAYESIDLEAGFLFGPLLLKRRDARLFARLREEQVYLRNLTHRTKRTQARYDAICRLLNSSAS